MVGLPSVNRFHDPWARRGALALVVLGGAGLRLFLLLRWPRRLNSDESTVSLIGLHILRGEFPVFFYSNAYMGTPEAYLTAVVYAAAGASPLTAKVVPFLVSCLVVPVAFLLGRRLAGWPGGLVAALLAALAPPFLPVFGNYAMLGYVEVVVIGSLVLLLTLDLTTEEQSPARRARSLLVLGLLAGLGWWINPLILSQLAAAGVVLLLHPAAWLSGAAWTAPFGFLLGSLPYWVFNLTHSFWSFVLFRKGRQGDVWQAGDKLAEPLLEITGVGGMLTDPVPLLSAAAGVVYLVVLAVLVVDLVRRPAPEAVVERRRRAGIVLLLLVCVFHLAAFSLSEYPGIARYLFPLYSALPVLAALALLRLGRRFRLLTAAALGILLLNNGWALVKTVRVFDAGLQTDWWKPEPVVELLVAEGISRAYADALTAPRLSFETRERLVVADPWGERYRPYRAWVDAAPRVAYILSERFPTRPGPFDAALQAIGAAYRRRDSGPFAVFYDFRPLTPEPLASLPPSGWRAETRPAGTDPSRAFDRDVDTAWLSQEPLRPAMWYRLDLGRLVPVAGITVLPVRPSFGVPRGFLIELSGDGTAWEPVASVPDFAFTLRWEHGQPRLDWSGRIVSRFATRPVRYVRLAQTGARSDQWWAIAEIFVYEPAAGPGRSEAVAAHLREGARLEGTGQRAAALAAYRQAVELDPEREDAHWKMVEVYANAGLPVDGSDPDRRALIFERLGMWGKAARQYEALDSEASQEGQHSDVLRRLREAYRRDGDARGVERIETRLAAEYTPPRRAEARFDRSPRLLGFGVEPDEPRVGGSLKLSYYWEATAPISENLTVFVHFVQGGRVHFSQDHEPLHGRYPTSQWRRGELVRERYRVRVPEEMPPGEYEIRVGLWNPRTGKRLPVAETSLAQVRDAVRIGTVRLLPAR